MNAIDQAYDTKWGLTRPLFRMAIVAISIAVPFQLHAEEKVAAVLKSREVSFQYRSNNNYLPCHELQRRVANILQAVGARDDLKVSAHGCEGFMMPRDQAFDDFERRDPMRDRFAMHDRRQQREEQMAHVRVELMTPVPVTPQVLAEIDKDKSRRELISRVTGNPMAAMNDPIIFPAQRQTVTLSRRTIRLEPEDCQLLDQMATSVFRDLNVRVVRRSHTCDRNQTSMIAPQMTVEALLPAAVSQAIPGSESLGSESPPETPVEATESTAEPTPASAPVTQH